jgi:hypothetical protein
MTMNKGKFLGNSDDFSINLFSIESIEKQLVLAEWCWSCTEDSYGIVCETEPTMKEDSICSICGGKYYIITDAGEKIKKFCKM